MTCTFTSVTEKFFNYIVVNRGKIQDIAMGAKGTET